MCLHHVPLLYSVFALMPKRNLHMNTLDSKDVYLKSWSTVKKRIFVSVKFGVLNVCLWSWLMMRLCWFVGWKPAMCAEVFCSQVWWIWVEGHAGNPCGSDIVHWVLMEVDLPCVWERMCWMQQEMTLHVDSDKLLGGRCCQEPWEVLAVPAGGSSSFFSPAAFSAASPTCCTRPVMTFFVLFVGFPLVEKTRVVLLKDELNLNKPKYSPALKGRS